MRARAESLSEMRDSPCPPTSFLKTSGGIFHDLMIHHIDQAQWVVGDEVAEVPESEAPAEGGEAAPAEGEASPAEAPPSE